MTNGTLFKTLETYGSPLYIDNGDSVDYDVNNPHSSRSLVIKNTSLLRHQWK